MRLSKRCFDIFFSFIGAILTLPLFLVIALLIKSEDRGPVFYRQERIGYKGKPFYLWKFRTMIVDADRQGILLTVGRDPRITKVGHYLRKCKFDEVPQLFNVLHGEMSFVGPRPEVRHYVEKYDINQQKVLSLVPGITDIASIRFSNESDILANAKNPEEVYIQEIMPEKILLNYQYASSSTLWSDFKVILKTIVKIISIKKYSISESNKGQGRYM